MNATALLSSLLGIALFAGVVVVALTVAKSVFGTGSRRAAATEVAAKLVAYPTASDGVLRRRFVRALTAQHVVMPSGERLAFSDLTVRVAPEDLERLDPDADLERLGDDAATLYRTHAEREGWALPGDVSVTVEVDPGLRAGWIPPARGTRRREPVGVLGWSAVRAQEDTQVQPMATVSALRPTADGSATVTFTPPTVAVRPGLRLEHGADVITLDATQETVLGRGADSPLIFREQEVSSRHAAVRWRDGHWQVSDLGSTNGTTLDGQPVADWTTLTPDSVLLLADVPVRVRSRGGQ